MIAVISDNKKESIGEKLFEYFVNNNIEAEFISASDRNIKPCYGCEGCTFKTYGKCIVRDDMDEILPVIAKSDCVVYTTPVLWGGTSYDIKRILDKSALLGNRFYKVRKREIVKGTCVGLKKIVLIGSSESSSDKVKESFVYLAKELGNIMDIKCFSKVINAYPTNEEIQKIAKGVLE